MNPNIDPDNSLYDRESDENFEIQESSAEDDIDEDAEMQSVESDSSDEGIKTRRGRLQRNV
jgi:hypothetical protein